jgi:hypothetical protein
VRRSLPLSFLLLLLVAACDCGGDDDTIGRSCMSSSDCSAGEICIDNVCESRDLPDGGDADALMCGATETLCGLRCCAEGELCSDTEGCVTDCGGETLCGDFCCGDGELCSGGECIPDCGDGEQLCGEGGEQVCCTSDQACLSNMCADLGVECEFTEECELDEICLASLGRCAPRDSVEVCEFVPEVGPFNPEQACRWVPESGDRANWDDVVMTPSVANMTDDNGDGVTDTSDIPDIVFISFDRQSDGCCTERGRVRIVSGLCNEDGTMDTIHTIESPFVDNSSGIALGNLHPDSMPGERPPEIVATFKSGGTIAWRRTADDGTAWEELWRNDTYLGAGAINRGGAQPAIVDVNADGQPEVLVGNVVLDGLTGALVWDGASTVGGGAGVGNNSFIGPVSTAADIDLDGDMEVLAGNTVYNGADGSEVWTFTFTSSNSSCGGDQPCDGYNAVGNLDDDPEAEVVIVREGEVFIIEHTGEQLEKVVLPSIDCGGNESGPPTIADFDGDGRAEIGTASADYYVVVDLDCIPDDRPAACDSRGILWKFANQDCSSRATGSSVFDFEGDGAAEVVYADETSFYVFDGRDGSVLYQDSSHSSNTRMEMPIVVDVDNDGKSEVIVPEPNTGGGAGGIDVWEDPMNNWVRTRRIWNQHTYHVTNITEDGQVPRLEEPNWTNERLNNFRQNVQPGGLFDAPDLQIESIVLAACNASTDTAEIEVTVTNAGALGVAPGVPVVAYATQDGGTEELIGVERTTRFLLPGQSETITFTWSPAGGFTASTFTVRAIVDDDGEGGSEYNECIEDNNESTSMAFMTCMLG